MAVIKDENKRLSLIEGQVLILGETIEHILGPHFLHYEALFCPVQNPIIISRIFVIEVVIPFDLINPTARKVSQRQEDSHIICYLIKCSIVIIKMVLRNLLEEGSLKGSEMRIFDGQLSKLTILLL